MLLDTEYIEVPPILEPIRPIPKELQPSKTPWKKIFVFSGLLAMQDLKLTRKHMWMATPWPWKVSATPFNSCNVITRYTSPTKERHHETRSIIVALIKIFKTSRQVTPGPGNPRPGPTQVDCANRSGGMFFFRIRLWIPHGICFPRKHHE